MCLVVNILCAESQGGMRDTRIVNCAVTIPAVTERGPTIDRNSKILSLSLASVLLGLISFLLIFPCAAS
jgi:hypothetical protein